MSCTMHWEGHMCPMLVVGWLWPYPLGVLIRVQCLDAECTDTSRDVGTMMLVVHPLRVCMRSLVA